MKRTGQCLTKLNRVNKTLRHEEPDRIPVSDFFFDGFLKKWREFYGIPQNGDINRYYDLDYTVSMPNNDLKIGKYNCIKKTETETIFRTAFGSLVRIKDDCEMPEYLEFEVNTIEKMRAFQFDDPWDERRFIAGGLNEVTDNTGDTVPPWIDSVKELWTDIPVYGSLCEGYESLWRIIGSENALLWIGMYPDEIGRFVERINEFSIEFLKAQIKAASGMLDGIMIWGDVAYVRGMLFSPTYWRKYFKPGVKALIDVCRENNLPVIYHGCGDSREIYEDLIEIGVDAYNPLEAKTGIDVVDLRRQYGHRLAFAGNMDVIAWAHADQDELKRIVLRKLNAAKGGGFIFQSDAGSVSDDISPEKFDYVINLVREYGEYPLELGEYDIPDLK